jgi:hypothetical protein
MLAFCFIVFNMFWQKHEDNIDSSTNMVIHIYTESRDRASNVMKRIKDMRDQMINSKP